MTEIVSMEEIKERYRDEWVLLVDVEADPGPVFRRARVACGTVTMRTRGGDGRQAWSRAHSACSTWERWPPIRSRS